MIKDKPCTRQDSHTPAPREFTTWQTWASEMSRTHVQRRCEGSCGLWTVWVLRSRTVVSQELRGK